MEIPDGFQLKVSFEVMSTLPLFSVILSHLLQQGAI